LLSLEKVGDVEILSPAQFLETIRVE